MQDPDGGLAQAVKTLRRGGLVVYPTETLYGLAADATNQGALERLVQVKGREPGKPIAVLVSDLTMLEQLVSEIPKVGRLLARRFWPGPLTIVCTARPEVSDLLTGGSGGIGARVSSHALAAALVRAFGKPLTTPSANPAGQPAPRQWHEARRYFGDKVDYYLDGGTLAGEPPSTVVDVRGELKIIRDAAIAGSLIEAVVREEREE